ncbi:chorismate pyruvate-lyase family protein [Pantoea sp. A4]|uniref:chorismate pyruvate-lyase family protein n=1 Tax=Pantoea sp. A4 TaxID=1225184 RepID=UPI000369C0CF|nr:chorismate pyruvate-lyase family protein [Pantoea sp. A4]
MRTLAIIKQVRVVDPQAKITVVLLSLKNIFYKLYKQEGCKVVILSNEISDHSKVSHLSKKMNWESYIDGYISSAFLNGGLILKYTALYIKYQPDLIVSDYNLSASAAAHIANFPHALVTERYDFTLFQISNRELNSAGFTLNKTEISDARASLHRIFSGIINSARIILTDKPYIASLDKDTALESASKEGKVRFVGPMTREINTADESIDPEYFTRLGLNISIKDKLIVASVGGTTMFIDNKQKLIDRYISLYEQLSKEIDSLKMVLISREKITCPAGITVFDYIPDWLPLLKRADLLLSAPGWITVTEVALVRVPVIYILADKSEYHEFEASKRLKIIGFESLVNPPLPLLVQRVRQKLRQKRKIKFQPYDALAPFSNGANAAAQYLLRSALPVNNNSLPAPADAKVTRMLLSNTGSTTVLLESLFDTKISVEVLVQHKQFQLSKIEQQTLQPFFDLQHGELTRRESRLFSQQGDLLCQATVFYQSETAVNIPTQQDITPLGKMLMSNSIRQHRHIISTGTTVWLSAQGQRACAFKEYIINCEGEKNIYVREEFNPEFIALLPQAAVA